MAAGFLVWIFVDPPGHSSWFVIPGALAMAIAGLPQLRVTLLIKPFAVAIPLALAVYILVLPQLSTFLQLGAVLFTLLFINCYVFSGIARLAGNVAITNVIAIQNQQTYVFAPLANSALFIFLSFLFVYGLTYALGSPRPEKVVLGLMGRFFRSAERLVSHSTLEPEHALSPMERWKIAYHRRELGALPAKIGAWNRTIDRELFPGSTPEQVQTLVTSLQALVYRMEELLGAGQAGRARSVMRELDNDLELWRRGFEQAFARWSDQPEAQPRDDKTQSIKAWLGGFETRVAEAVERARSSVTEQEGESFYRLLGAYRGLSAAALAYAGAASSIDWNQWREERFS